MKGYRKQNSLDGTATFIKPLDIEIEPGKRVRDLPDLISCTHAIEKLAQEINDIAVQIDRAEASANKPPLEWFGKAMKAKRWKKRAMKAIRAHATFLRQTNPAHDEERTEAILRVIREDIGETAMEAYVATAKRRYPEVFERSEGGAQ